MAQYVVLSIANNAVPADGQTGTALIYLGEHANETEACTAASTAFGAQSGQFLWWVLASSFLRDVATTTVTRTVAPG